MQDCSQTTSQCQLRKKCRCHGRKNVEISHKVCLERFRKYGNILTALKMGSTKKLGSNGHSSDALKQMQKNHVLLPWTIRKSRLICQHSLVNFILVAQNWRCVKRHETSLLVQKNCDMIRLCASVLWPPPLLNDKLESSQKDESNAKEISSKSLCKAKAHHTKKLKTFFVNQAGPAHVVAKFSGLFMFL